MILTNSKMNARNETELTCNANDKKRIRLLRIKA